MCVGTPSICTKVGGTDVYVKDGINGILVDNNDINTLIATLELRNLEGLEYQLPKTTFNYTAPSSMGGDYSQRYLFEKYLYHRFMEGKID